MVHGQTNTQRKQILFEMRLLVHRIYARFLHSYGFLV